MDKLFADIPLELTFPCPACGGTVSFPVDHSETTFTCSRCKKTLPVPDSQRELLPIGRYLQDRVRND